MNQMNTEKKEAFVEQVYNPIPEDLFIRYSEEMEGQSFYHMHNAYELYFLLEGDMNYYIDRQCYHISSGTMLTIRPGEYHRCEILNDKVYNRFVINVSNHFLEKYSTLYTNLKACFHRKSEKVPNIVLLEEAQAKQLQDLHESMLGAKEKGGFGEDVIVTAYAMQLFVQVNSIFFSNKDARLPNVMPPLVNETIGYINTHYLEPFSLEELSKKLLYNGTYISRKFKSVTGLSIQEYILRKRIHLAQNHLGMGKSVTESSMLSGFGEYTNFSKVFKKYVGVSPKQYQMKIIEKHDTSQSWV